MNYMSVCTLSNIFKLLSFFFFKGEGGLFHMLVSYKLM